MKATSWQQADIVRRHFKDKVPVSSPAEEECSWRENRLKVEYYASEASFGVPPNDLSVNELCKTYEKHCEMYYGMNLLSDNYLIEDDGHTNGIFIY